MRCLLAAVCAAVLFVSGGANAQDRFEGSVTWRTLLVGPKALQARLGETGMNNPEQVFALPTGELLQAAQGGEPQLRSSETTIHIQGAMLRSPSLEGGPEDYDILDLENGIGWLVAPSAKAYVKQTTEEMQAVATQLYEAALEARGEEPPERAPQPKRVVQPLGESKKIKGITTEGYAIDAEGEKSIGWVTQDFPGLRWANWRYSDYIASILPASLERPKTVRDTLESVGLPIQLKTLSTQPQTTYRYYEVSKIDRRELPDSMFRVPVDYRAVTVRELWHLQQRQQAPAANPERFERP